MGAHAIVRVHSSLCFSGGQIYLNVIRVPPWVRMRAVKAAKRSLIAAVLSVPLHHGDAQRVVFREYPRCSATVLMIPLEQLSLCSPLLDRLVPSRVQRSRTADSPHAAAKAVAVNNL